jgi:hypothetical protein
MERYIDVMHGTGATIAQSTEVARHAIQSVNLDQDSESPSRCRADGSVDLEKQDQYKSWQLID